MLRLLEASMEILKRGHHETFPTEFEFPVEDLQNGLVLLGKSIPEEMIIKILAYVDPEQSLKLSLVCKRWYNITRSYQFWSEIYKNRYKRKSKKFPWYVFYCLFATNYFVTNLIKNGNGEKGLKHWNVTSNGGDGFTIEPQPAGANSLPLDVPEFNGKTSCFATSYSLCQKHQTVRIKSKLFLHILNTYRPHIYASEWVSGRFDCGSTYLMTIQLKNKENLTLAEQYGEYQIEQWADPRWTKVAVMFANYPEGVNRIVFQHQGKDTQFWKDHYGTKMAGAVVKFIFDSMQPLNESERDV